MTSPSNWHDLAERLALKESFDLLTVLEVDWNQNLVRRSFSTDEANYPSGGVKRLMGSAWADQVIFGGQPFLSTSIAEFRSAFADYETLEALGWRFALNVPCREHGRTVRTLNLLRGACAYPERAIEVVREEIRRNQA